MSLNLTANTLTIFPKSRDFRDDPSANFEDAIDNPSLPISITSKTVDGQSANLVSPISIPNTESIQDIKNYHQWSTIEEFGYKFEGQGHFLYCVN